MNIAASDPRPRLTIPQSPPMQTIRLSCLSNAGLAVALLYAAAAHAVTVGDPNNPGNLNAAIQSAYAGGATSITITPGKYVMPGTLKIANMSNATITATNVEISMTTTSDVIDVNNCTSVTFQGATAHYANPLFCQAKILAFGTDSTKGPYYDVQIDAGYPFSATFSSSYVFDPATGKIKFGTWDTSAASVQALNGSGQTRLFWGTSNTNLLPSNGYNVAVGDYVVCRGGGNTMLHADGCTNCTFQNLIFYWGGVFGFFDTSAKGNHYLNDQIIRGPVPPGATRAPMISQSADGLHSAGPRVGPDIENCYFESMCDDGIAIHGYYATITAVSGNTITTTDNHYQAGDTARISNGSGFIAQTTVQSVQSLGNNSYLITLASNVGAHVGDLAGNPSASGPGYKVINNTIKNNRARGMLLKGDNGLVQGNTVDGSTMSGISIGPEQPSEGDYCQTVMVKQNTISNTNYATNNRFYNGAIWVHGNGAQGNTGITIQNNTMDSILGPNLVIQWANGVQINSNTFSNTHAVAVGTNAELTTVVQLDHCNSVSFQNNKVSSMGPNAVSIYQAASTATNITGAKSGLYLFNEAEDLAVAAFSGPAPRIFADGAASNGEGMIIDATASGNSMTLTFPNVPAGTYDVQMGLKDFPTRGIFQLAIGTPNAGPTNYGSPVDEFIASGQSYPLVNFGNWTGHTSTTDKWFWFTVTGKNAASSSYTIAVDYIMLIPQ